MTPARGFIPLEKNDRRKSVHRVARTSLAGFTLIELLIVIGILSMLAAVDLVVNLQSYRSFVFRSDAETLRALLYTARSNSMNGIDGSAWSVCQSKGDYVLFPSSGSPYNGTSAERVAIERAAVDLPDCANGGVTFAPLSGTTAPTTITVLEAERTSVITINYEGRID